MSTPRNEPADEIRKDRPLGWTGQDWRATVDAALEAARAEGRREAVERIEKQLDEKRARYGSTQPVRFGFLEPEIRHLLRAILHDTEAPEGGEHG